MHFNTWTNVVSEHCAGPQAVQQPLYSQPYYTCLTLTDVPKLMPAAHSHYLLLYVLSPAFIPVSHLFPPTCCIVAARPQPQVYFSSNWQAELLKADPLCARVLIINCSAGFWQIWEKNVKRKGIVFEQKTLIANRLRTVTALERKSDRPIITTQRSKASVFYALVSVSHLFYIAVDRLEPVAASRWWLQKHRPAWDRC